MNDKRETREVTRGVMLRVGFGLSEDNQEATLD